jgi:hypothetical protein
MAKSSTQESFDLDTPAFYRRTLHILADEQVPFLVGGSHAFLHYTGIVRDTKDLDIFVRREELGRALGALEQAGYRTEITFPHWLAKAFHGDDFIDIVFSSGNGVATIDDAWFANAVEAQVLNMPVKLLPVEELIWQKSYIMERERYDGADVAHLLRACVDSLDWTHLLDRFAPHWQLLFSHVLMFMFVYPSEVHRLPREVMGRLAELLREQLDAPSRDDRVCQGTLLSRSQFLIDIGRYGYEDARLQPRGNMKAEEVVYWTWAIEHVK